MKRVLETAFWRAIAGTLFILMMILSGAAVLCGCAATQTIETVPSEASDLIQENQINPDFVIIDAQSIEEYKRRHIDGATNVPIDSETFKNDGAGLLSRQLFVAAISLEITSNSSR